MLQETKAVYINVNFILCTFEAYVGPIPFFVVPKLTKEAYVQHHVHYTHAIAKVSVIITTNTLYNCL